MRPRVELALALGLLVLVGLLAIATRDREAERVHVDPRRSTFLAGPSGSRGLADALERMGHTVSRFRRRMTQLTPPSGDKTLLAVLDPAYVVDQFEARRLAAYGKLGGDLLLAGIGANQVMRCYGYTIDARSTDSVQVVAPGQQPSSRSPWTGDMVLATVVDSAGADSVAEARVKCNFTPVLSVDSLLVTPGGRLAAVRLVTGHNSVVLVADGALFSNRKVRDSDAGEFALGIMADYPRVLFDEYHQGFTSGGSLLGALLSWSGGTAWGWAWWQLSAVGLLALLAAAFRFGPPIAAIKRQRRSPLEHVRALATALATARGSDLAVRLMIQGLRRRLSVGRQGSRSDPREWLVALARNVRTARSRAAIQSLLELTQRGANPQGVLRAANAVEDVWQDLSPSQPKK
jgi:Domain of unknown function (DUF4350)